MATFNVKGFLEIPSLITNAPGAIAEIGQLSNHSRTFSLDQDEYSDPAKDVSNLIVFECLSAGTRAQLTNEATEYVFDMMEHIDVNFVTTTPFEEQLNSSFGVNSGADVPLTNIQCGAEILTAGKIYPTWIGFTLDIGGNTFNMKLWLSDSVFRSEYDSFDIRVIGPTGTVPELYSTFANVKSSLSLIDLEEHVSRVETVRANNPFTKQKIVELEWVDPENDENIININFFCLVYGPAGENRENLLEAVRNYLVDNSTYTVEEWTVYFSELVTINHMTIIPQWDREAMSAVDGGGVGTEAAVYSPVVLYDRAMDNARKVLTEPTLTELKKVTDITHLAYKTLGILVIGSENNNPGFYRFSDVYPDYTVLSANVPDVRNMKAITTSLITRLGVMVRICAEDDGSVELPVGYSRASINGVNVIEMTENNIVFRMATKQSYLNKIGV